MECKVCPSAQTSGAISCQPPSSPPPPPPAALSPSSSAGESPTPSGSQPDASGGGVPLLTIVIIVSVVWLFLLFLMMISICSHADADEPREGGRGSDEAAGAVVPHQRKANQVMPASGVGVAAFASSKTSSKARPLKAESLNPFATNEALFIMTGATSGKGPVFASTYMHKSPGPSSAATESLDLALGSGYQPSSVQSSGAALFKTCQAEIGLWKYLEVGSQDVKRGKLLGKGSYAEVYQGRALGGDCAIKLYRSTASAKQLDDAKREIALGASLDHPCTLRILGWVRAPLQTITELCRGDLKAFYNDKIDGLPYSEMKSLQLLKVGLCCYVTFVVSNVRHQVLQSSAD